MLIFGTVGVLAWLTSDNKWGRRSKQRAPRRSRELLTVAGGWDLGPFPSDPHGEGLITALPDGLRFDAGPAGPNFSLPWDQLESYGSQDYAVEFLLSGKSPWSCFVVAKPTSMAEKRAWLELLEKNRVPKAQRRASA